MAAYTATFTVASTQADKLREVFASEDKELSNKRGSYSLESTENTITITAEASDAVAFRAIVNAISKVLAIFEKMQQV